MCYLQMKTLQEISFLLAYGFTITNLYLLHELQLNSIATAVNLAMNFTLCQYTYTTCFTIAK